MHNKQAIVMKNLVDRVRESHETVKFGFYTMDNSEGAKLLMEDTKKKPLFKARYLNPDALALRNSLFGENKNAKSPL